jgi:hypothetical protein
MNSDKNKDLSTDFNDAKDPSFGTKFRKNSVPVSKVDSKSELNSKESKSKQVDNTIDDFKDKDWENTPLYSEFLQKGKSEFNSDNYD